MNKKQQITVKGIEIREEVHSPDFNYGKFAIIKNEAGLIKSIKKFNSLFDKGKLLFTFTSLGFECHSLTKTPSQHEME